MKNQLLSISISHSFMAASLMIISVLNRHHGEGFNKCFWLAGNITVQSKMKLSIEICANARDYNIQIFQHKDEVRPPVTRRRARSYVGGPGPARSEVLYVKLSLCMPFFRRQSGTVIKPSLSPPRSESFLAVRTKWGLGRGRWLSQWTQACRPKFGSSVSMSKATCGRSLQLSTRHLLDPCSLLPSQSSQIWGSQVQWESLSQK